MEVINTGTVLLRHFHCISICSPDVNRVAYVKGVSDLTYRNTATRLQPLPSWGAGAAQSADYRGTVVRFPVGVKRRPE